MERIQPNIDVFTAVVAGLRSQGRTVVLAPGVFDVLHAGHIRMLTDARSRGDYLIVAIQSDAAARKYKGASRPVVPAEERAEVIAALGCVHYVTFFESADASDLVRKLKPNVVVRGHDVTDETFPERAAAAAVGGKVLITGDTKVRSVAAFLEKAAKGLKASVPSEKATVPSKAAAKPVVAKQLAKPVRANK